MEIRQPVNSKKKNCDQAVWMKNYNFRYFFQSYDEIPGPLDKGVSITKGYFGELDYQSTHEYEQQCFARNRRARRTAHFISTRFSLSSRVDFQQSHARLFCFLLLDHRQFYVGVHIPLRPRKHHHHQRHHHHRRRHRSLTLDSTESGEKLCLHLLVISVKVMYIRHTLCFFLSHGGFFVSFVVEGGRFGRNENSFKRSVFILQSKCEQQGRANLLLPL